MIKVSFRMGKNERKNFFYNKIRNKRKKGKFFKKERKKNSAADLTIE